ncbi:hypothetical protein [Hydrogenophaga sp.]|uniref:hypothetical protein n=1 Tax=Hydrogenophaga sp. TaxID=1904254 RepID=UPI002721FA9A|nr:hypothetical protein [Hydrogenophaga sp.]MDO9434073.1 hypothetical protein [Hydrogenophaga sp.]
MLELLAPAVDVVAVAVAVLVRVLVDVLVMATGESVVVAVAVGLVGVPAMTAGESAVVVVVVVVLVVVALREPKAVGLTAALPEPFAVGARGVRGVAMTNLTLLLLLLLAFAGDATLNGLVEFPDVMTPGIGLRLAGSDRDGTLDSFVGGGGCEDFMGTAPGGG